MGCLLQTRAGSRQDTLLTPAAVLAASAAFALC